MASAPAVGVDLVLPQSHGQAETHGSKHGAVVGSNGSRCRCIQV
jgi:hypothetical protein